MTPGTSEGPAEPEAGRDDRGLLVVFQGSSMEGLDVDLAAWAGVTLTEEEADFLKGECNDLQLLRQCDACLIEEDDADYDEAPGKGDTFFTVKTWDVTTLKLELAEVIREAVRDAASRYGEDPKQRDHEAAEGDTDTSPDGPMAQMGAWLDALADDEVAEISQRLVAHYGALDPNVVAEGLAADYVALKRAKATQRSARSAPIAPEGPAQPMSGRPHPASLHQRFPPPPPEDGSEDEWA